VKALHEPKKRRSSEEKAPGMLHVNRILVPHYSISMTTSGKGLERLDVSA
jgi:hypothetical protein